MNVHLIRTPPGRRSVSRGAHLPGSPGSVTWLDQALADGSRAPPEPAERLVRRQVLTQVRRLGADHPRPPDPENPPVHLKAEILLPGNTQHGVAALNVHIVLSHYGCDTNLVTPDEVLYDMLSPWSDELAASLERTMACSVSVRVALGTWLPLDAS